MIHGTPVFSPTAMFPAHWTYRVPASLYASWMLLYSFSICMARLETHYDCKLEIDWHLSSINALHASRWRNWSKVCTWDRMMGPPWEANSFSSFIFCTIILTYFFMWYCRIGGIDQLAEHFWFFFLKNVWFPEFGEAHYLEWWVVGTECDILNLSQPIGKPSGFQFNKKMTRTMSATGMHARCRHNIFEDKERHRRKKYPWFHSAWMKGPTRRVTYILFSPINLMNFTKS